MPLVRFTQNLQRHVACPAVEVPGATVRELLDRAFEGNPQARGYILNDQGGVRTHIVIFVDGQPIRDRTGLSDPVAPQAAVDVMQALSGG